MRIKVLLVDDHALLRGGVRQYVKCREELELVGEAAGGAEGLKQAEELCPDLAIVDLHLPDLPGLEVTRQMLKARPHIKILIFSGDNKPFLVSEALQAGAHGYVLKSAAGEELAEAITTVFEGKTYISPQLCSEILLRTLGKQREASGPNVQDRELRLLRLIAEGLRNKEIATELDLSPKSVETYRGRLMKKLGCESTAELVRYAVREGIITA